MLLMARYPDNYFDLAIVDIPYGLGDKLTQGGTWENKYKKSDADWDVLPTKDYFNELFRISKNQIIFGANHFISKIAFDSSCWIVWDKCNGENDFADCELAWTSFNGALRKITKQWFVLIQM